MNATAIFQAGWDACAKWMQTQPAAFTEGLQRVLEAQEPDKSEGAGETGKHLPKGGDRIAESLRLIAIGLQTVRFDLTNRTGMIEGDPLASATMIHTLIREILTVHGGQDVDLELRAQTRLAESRREAIGRLESRANTLEDKNRQLADKLREAMDCLEARKVEDREIREALKPLMAAIGVEDWGSNAFIIKEEVPGILRRMQATGDSLKLLGEAHAVARAQAELAAEHRGAIAERKRIAKGLVAETWEGGFDMAVKWDGVIVTSEEELLRGFGGAEGEEIPDGWIPAQRIDGHILVAIPQDTVAICTTKDRATWDEIPIRHPEDPQ